MATVKLYFAVATCVHDFTCAHIVWGPQVSLHFNVTAALTGPHYGMCVQPASPGLESSLSPVACAHDLPEHEMNSALSGGEGSQVPASTAGKGQIWGQHTPLGSILAQLCFRPSPSTELGLIPQDTRLFISAPGT